MFSLFSIFLLFCPFSCALTHHNSTGNTHEVRSLRRVAVVDGQRIIFRAAEWIPAKLGDVPYQVALMLQVSRTQYEARCGGSLIAPRKILTAAHCIELVSHLCECECLKGFATGRDLQKYRIVAGQLKGNTRSGQGGGQWRVIDYGFFPETYKYPKDDIAFLYTKNGFKYNFAVQPIALATKDIDYKNNCLASGYGSDETKILMVAYLSPISKRLCDQMHQQNFEKFICTNDSTTSDVFNKGDSGGPLVCNGTGDPAENKRGIVAGVLTGKDLQQRMGTFFTRVSSYRKLNCVSRCEAGNWFLLCLTLVYLLWTQY